MDSRRADSTESASEKMTSFNASTPPVASAVATTACAVLGVTGAILHQMTFSSAQLWSITACIGAYVAGGYGPTLNAFVSLLNKKLNVDLLMVIAAIGAAIIGDWIEGVVLLFLFSLSGTLEAFAIFRTNQSIESLVQLRPREAWLVLGGNSEDKRIPVESLQIDDVIRIRSGERFSVDGVVTEGETWVDEATLTGESELIHKQVGDQVFSGTINGAGSVLVRMTKAVNDTTLERIVHMVQEAQAQKTPAQRLVESWQQPYVIGVLTAASLVFFGARIIHTSSWYDAFYHSMVLLVAASPCAVVVGAPAVLLSAIARAGRQGVLFKGGVHLESLGTVDTIAFDKTGTVTLGKPSVTEIWTPAGIDQSKLLGLAATVEHKSEHPLGIPVMAEARSRQIAISEEPIEDFHSHTGLGIHARVGGTWVGVGREGLFASHEICIPQSIVEQSQRIRERGETSLMVITDDPLLFGVIAVADQLRPEATATMVTLKKLGIKTLVMLTGDHERVAKSIAQTLCIDEVRAGLLPDQKVIEITRLEDRGLNVAMVGDGVNDAPALAAAEVGIAMGGAGTDVALEVADVVLMRDGLRALPFAVWISRLARKRVRQNMIFAFAMIAILVISTFFSLPLWLGVLGHEGSTVLVVFNGLRILWMKTPDFARIGRE
ncbi:MAG: heavy metal translocating P-type ATPase [Planctomycetota bacterium]|nr:heavy metal translocating P-type ATPase [Planctomycetota bacterium]